MDGAGWLAWSGTQLDALTRSTHDHAWQQDTWQAGHDAVALALGNLPRAAPTCCRTKDSLLHSSPSSSSGWPPPSSRLDAKFSSRLRTRRGGGGGRSGRQGEVGHDKWSNAGPGQCPRLLATDLLLVTASPRPPPPTHSPTPTHATYKPKMLHGAPMEALVPAPAYAHGDKEVQDDVVADDNHNDKV